ncbi:hypothetical protein GCM10027360_22560 [Amycolatopsis echigonensis]
MDATFVARDAQFRRHVSLAFRPFELEDEPMADDPAGRRRASAVDALSVRNRRAAFPRRHDAIPGTRDPAPRLRPRDRVAAIAVRRTACQRSEAATGDLIAAVPSTKE